jgi:hypothetical protein
MVYGNQETIARHFRLQPESMAQLDALCERHGGITRSDMLRMMITTFYHTTFGKNATLPDPPTLQRGRKPAERAKKRKR